MLQLYVHKPTDLIPLPEVTEEVKHLLIVIENDNHVLVKKSGVVHGFIGHATSDSSITNHSHTVVLATLQAHFYTEQLPQPFMLLFMQLFMPAR